MFFGTEEIKGYKIYNGLSHEKEGEHVVGLGGSSLLRIFRIIMTFGGVSGSFLRNRRLPEN